MEIKIDLDMNQIDYDAINKQIQEKIAALDIKDMYDVNTKIDNKISNYIEDEIIYHYNRYLARYFGESTSPEGRNLIEDMSKEEIKKRTKEVIDDVFANDFNEEVLRKMVIEFLPDIFTSILFNRMDYALFSKEHDYKNQMYSMIRSQISTELSKRVYR